MGYTALVIVDVSAASSESQAGGHEATDIPTDLVYTQVSVNEWECYILIADAIPTQVNR